ncbi:MAG: hypothetical protein HQK50_07615 [Oligoflexia bacterium]|nr:hypothetical protein [Oligoflexia bacterium]MBF0365423.1 hypothetical protein [Oligoflexia bacterium]
MLQRYSQNGKFDSKSGEEHLNQLLVLAIYREEAFSNHAITADRAIMDESCERICDRAEEFGFEVLVRRVPGEQYKELTVQELKSFHLILSMAQGEDLLARLKRVEVESEKCSPSFPIVINSVDAIENCFRLNLSKKLKAAHLPYPEFLVIDPREIGAPASESLLITHFIERCGGGVWVKRGDFHALSDQDVVFVKGQEELWQSLQHFCKEGVERVILQRHVEGDIFKFYKVIHRHFSYRKIHTSPTASLVTHTHEQQQSMRLLAGRVGEELALEVYGGDIVIDGNGKLHVIDVNDWPSFRSSLKDAAIAVADLCWDKVIKSTLLHHTDLLNKRNSTRSLAIANAKEVKGAAATQYLYGTVSTEHQG